MQLTHGSPPALALHNFVFRAGTPPLDLILRRQDCVALLGIGPDEDDMPSLTAALTGRATCQGAMRIDGMDVSAHRPGQRGVASVGAHAPLFAHLSVMDNILFPLRAARTLGANEMQRRASEVLALTGLDGVRARYPRDLSAEQVFRAGLARALVGMPAVVVLMQPFDTMKQTAKDRMLAMLDRLRHAMGLSLLLLTRQRPEALMAADRIGIMENGVLLQLAQAPILLNRPASRGVAVAMGDANVLTGKVLDCEDDLATLRLPSGETVQAQAAPGLHADDLASICIPPDRLSVMFMRQGGGEPPEPGDIACTLVSAHHLGQSVLMRLRARDGTEIIARRPPVHAGRDLAPGREGLLAWQAQNAIAFPMDQKIG
ncbi:TOBE domain-containing protein [Acetobacter sp. TBRC 12305]|uniref:TOBE domain-containing protein n=1 Tax=Acetobacter garciniae TaxID=2817435 RepID=A0A939HMI6_9PROT|nr:TOBE domain-containing protein [Acetobacter garciniae]MBO1324846.1 TOBE domain-containing protein [Acetobacter garciniae]MBX0344537.1 TOBE domain-containing protein [Acetobacter garciniae]